MQAGRRNTPIFRWFFRCKEQPKRSPFSELWRNLNHQQGNFSWTHPAKLSYAHVQNKAWNPSGRKSSPLIRSNIMWSLQIRLRFIGVVSQCRGCEILIPCRKWASSVNMRFSHSCIWVIGAALFWNYSDPPFQKLDPETMIRNDRYAKKRSPSSPEQKRN